MSALLVLLAGAFTLGGVVLGGLIAFAVEAKRWQRERADQKRERIRQAYAEWVGAFLGLTDHLCRYLVWEEQGKKMPRTIGMDYLDADQKESIAFARVKLTDGDKKRTKDAQEVRAPLRDRLQEDPPTMNVEEFTELDNRQKLAMRRFLDRVCDELDGEEVVDAPSLKDQWYAFWRWVSR